MIMKDIYFDIPSFRDTLHQRPGFYLGGATLKDKYVGLIERFLCNIKADVQNKNLSATVNIELIENKEICIMCDVALSIPAQIEPTVCGSLRIARPLIEYVLTADYSHSACGDDFIKKQGVFVDVGPLLAYTSEIFRLTFWYDNREYNMAFHKGYISQLLWAKPCERYLEGMKVKTLPSQEIFGDISINPKDLVLLSDQLSEDGFHLECNFISCLDI